MEKEFEYHIFLYKMITTFIECPAILESINLCLEYSQIKSHHLAGFLQLTLTMLFSTLMSSSSANCFSTTTENLFQPLRYFKIAYAKRYYTIFSAAATYWILVRYAYNICIIVFAIFVLSWNWGGCPLSYKYEQGRICSVVNGLSGLNL